jgi:hypothetical protein
MRTERFKPGDLVWTVYRNTQMGVRGYVQSSKGYPPVVHFEPNTPLTIIRKALAKDYGIWSRHRHRGHSTAYHFAITSWLVLHDGMPVVILDEFLSKRRHKARKTKQQV